jgi:hypothetical protein
MPWEFRRLTPAEFNTLANARITDRKEQQDFMDALNARQCQIAVMVAGGKPGKIADYMLRPPELVPQDDDQMISGLIGFAQVVKEVRR